MARLLLLAVLLLALGACSPGDLPYELDDLPSGDATRGAALFAQPVGGVPACAACHAVDGGRSSGPPLKGYGAAAGERVDGQSAETYTFYSILRPARHVMRGYSNVMPGKYGDALNQQQVADLIAYILGL